MAVVALLSMAIAISEAGDRAALVVRVRGESDSAAVTVVARALAPMAVVPDQVERTVEESGACELPLLPARPYRVWAFAQRDDGSLVVSEATEPVFAPTSIELALSERREPVRLKLLNLEGFSPLGPFELRESERAIPMGADGIAQMPVLAADRADLALFGADGGALAKFEVGLTSAARAELRSSAEEARASALEPWSIDEPDASGTVTEWLPGPVEARLHVLGPRGDRVPGAVVFGMFGAGPWRPLATADPDGIARLCFATFFTRDRGIGGGVPKLLVRAAGCTEINVDEDGWRVVRSDEGKPESIEAFAKLPAGITIHGRLRAGPDRSAPGAELRGFTSIVSGENSTWFTWGDPEPFPIARDGRFEILGRSPRLALRLTAILGDELLAESSQPGGCPIWPEALLFCGPNADSAADLDLGDLSLSELVRVRLTVRNRDGSPAAHAHVRIAESLVPAAIPRHRFSMDVDLPRYPLHAWTDENGRIELWLEPSARPAVVVEAGRRCAVASLDLREEERGEVVWREITVDGGIPVSGVVAHADGGAPERAVVKADLRDASSGSDRAEGSGIASMIERLGFVNEVPSLNVRVAVDGSFRLSVPLSRRSWTLRAWGWQGSEARFRGEETVVVGETAVEGIRIVLEDDR